MFEVNDSIADSANRYQYFKNIITSIFKLLDIRYINILFRYFGSIFYFDSFGIFVNIFSLIFRFEIFVRFFRFEILFKIDIKKIIKLRYSVSNIGHRNF